MVNSLITQTTRKKLIFRVYLLMSIKIIYLGKNTCYSVYRKMASLQCTLWCLTRLLSWEKLLLHWQKENNFYPLCILLCWLKVYLRENALSHQLQGDGFFIVCTLWFGIKIYLQENDLSYWPQENGFSPECNRWWWTRVILWEKLENKQW